MAPVWLSGKAVFLPAHSPEVINILWDLLCGDENLEEQSHEHAGRVKDYRVLALRHRGHHPQHHSCLQKTKHLEMAFSTSVSMWQGLAGGAPSLLPRSPPLGQVSAQCLKQGQAGWGRDGELLER